MSHQPFRISFDCFGISTVCQAIYLTILLAVPPNSIADAYLDALHNEADELEYLDESRSSNTVSTQQKNISAEIKQALKSIAAFEQYFRKTDSATAAIYFRLTTQEHQRIYHRFKSTRDFNLAKKMTIELYNQKR